MTPATRDTTRNIGAIGFTDEGIRTQRGQRAAYYLAGVWTANGELVWSSEPVSYPTRLAALEAARVKKHVAG